MSKQRLSAAAAKAKAVRDLAYANSPAREKKRAENQRLRRAAVKAGVNIKGKHINETLMFLQRLPATSETSMQRDIAAGYGSEFDILVKHPKMLADQHSISTPVLTQCYETLISEKGKLSK